MTLLAKVGWEVRITPKIDGDEAEDDPVKRREFLAGVASVGFVPSPKTTPFHDPSYVELLTRRTLQAHNQAGGNSLITTLLGQGRKIQSASATGGYALQSAASDFMRQGSYVLRQAGRPDIAVQFANSAIRNASRAANPDRQAWAYCALILANTFNGSASTMSTANRSTGQAVTLAQRGLRIPGAGQEPRAFLNACLACSLANVPGNEKPARTALKEALNTDALSPIDQADIAGIAGSALRDMGERRDALKMLENAVLQSSPHSQFLQALYLCDQTAVALDIREPDLAASLMNGLSYLVPFVDSAMFDRQVEHVLQTARPWATVSAVRDARTRLQSVRVTKEDL